MQYANWNSQQGLFYQQQMQNQQDRNTLRWLGSRAGICLLVYNASGYIAYIALTALGVYTLYEQHVVFNSVVDILLSVLAVFLPFYLLFRKVGSREKTAVYQAFDAPRDKKMLLLAIPAGYLICIVANDVTNLFVSLMGAAGLELTYPRATYDTSFAGCLVAVLQVAVMPALVEEFAMRGVVMQPLRRYGDRFALVASSLIFALMHGNMVQIPFALLVGLGLGYLVMMTGSVWTGTMIHFINNFVSVVVSLLYASEVANETINTFYLLFKAAAVVAGLLCIVVFIKRYSTRRLCPASVTLPHVEKVRAYLLNPPMLLSLGLLIINTIFSMHIT